MRTTIEGPTAFARCRSWFVVETSALRQRFEFLSVMRRRRYEERGWVAFFARSEYEAFVIWWDDLADMIAKCSVGGLTCDGRVESFIFVGDAKMLI